MKFHRTRTTKSPCLPRLTALCIGVAAGLAVLIIVPVIAVEGQQNRGQYPQLPPIANPMPDANQQMEMQDQQRKQQNFEAANIERKKQIADDSAKLLKLATDLKTEVDKTNKDMLSLSVIRKAGEIEKLAHTVKEKMKLTVGGS
jgi:hypothetical protein